MFGWMLILVLFLLAMLIGIGGMIFIIFKVLPLSIKMAKIRIKEAEKYVKKYEEAERNPAQKQEKEDTDAKFRNNPDWEWDANSGLWRYKKRHNRNN